MGEEGAPLESVGEPEAELSHEVEISGLKE
jgi:hypothetical protein